MKPRKHDSIDIVAMLNKHKPREWDQKLVFWTINKSVYQVQKILYGIQCGMTDAEKKKKVTPNLTI